jgi:hypothetical protein
MDDSKKEIDLFYKENYFRESRLEENKSLSNFYNILKKSLEFYIDVKDMLPKEVRKPFTIYLIFYLAMKKKLFLEKDNQQMFIETIYHLNKLKEEKNNFDLFKLLRNQNQKGNREKIITESIKFIRDY